MIQLVTLCNHTNISWKSLLLFPSQTNKQQKIPPKNLFNADDKQ